MSVWDDLVGQDRAVAVLRRAVADPAAMSHAWLFTGPPGSGRSSAARAFAAALQCPTDGCGACPACRTSLTGTSADVELVSTSLLSHRVEDMRALVARAARHPVGGCWQIVVLEDADRLTEHAGNALLKAIEEPASRMVWLLCAPTAEDVLPTLRSRCRVVALRTPPPHAVAEVLVRRDGVDPAMAAFAARATQGHIGRARRLAHDEQARLRRAEVLRLPTALGGPADCLAAAAALVEAAAEEAKDATGELDRREAEQMRRALGGGDGQRGARLPGGAGATMKEMERQQRTRGKRMQRDALDRALIDLASFYRDVLVLQLDAEVELTNDELRPQLQKVARRSTPEQSLARLEAVLGCRAAVEANVAPLLAVEVMTLALRAG